VKLSRLEPYTFAQCELLKSISIPAPILSIGSRCFVRPHWRDPVCALETVTFEPDSKLQTIEPFAFSGCLALQSICLPASVETLDGSCFSQTGLRRIELEPGNRFFAIAGDFLVDIQQVSLIRYFGSGPDVVIPANFEKIGSWCFGHCSSISSIAFAPNSKLTEICSDAFTGCRDLQSIYLPPSVLTLGEHCFLACESLQTVSFPKDSVLNEIPTSGFESCVALESITFPSSVTSIKDFCFEKCGNLKSILFPPDTKLRAIAYAVFSHCKSLQSLVIPGSVERMGINSFYHCTSLSDVMFLTPSRIRQIWDLPPAARRPLVIPDSVEFIALPGSVRRGMSYALMFGRESKLGEISDRGRTDRRHGRSFLHLSTRTLKRFRKQEEFWSL
jgi:hypothetical protein